MVALKDPALSRFIDKPDPGVGVVLVYGPDDGLVSERGRAIVKAACGGKLDDFSVVRIDAESIIADPGRLADEALSVSMFGGGRTVWVRDIGGRNLSGAIAPLINTLPRDTLIVLEAGDIKKGAGLRGLVEDHPRAVAIACFPDDERALRAMIEAEAKAHGLAVSRESVDILVDHLGGDRLASRGEMQKLCLYCRGRDRIEPGDVEAILGDVSAFALDQLIDAVAGGDLHGVETGMVRLPSLEMPPSVVVVQTERHFLLLQRLRAEVDAGRRAADLVERTQPPIFYKRRPHVLAQLGLWTTPRLDRALAILHDTAGRARRAGGRLEATLVGEAFLTIARAAAAGRTRG